MEERADMYKLNIYKRKDGRYEGRVYIGKGENGKRSYRSFYGKDPDEAEQKFRAFLNEKTSIPSVTNITVRDIIYEWLKVKSLHVRESTLANYRMKSEKHIIPYFGDTDCGKIRSRDIYTFIDKKSSEGLSVRYVSDIIVLIKSVIKYAYSEYGVNNGINGLIMPKKSRPEVRLLTDEEQKRLKACITAAPDRTSVGIALALSTGLRIGEVCALRREDINLEKRILTVRHTIQRIRCHDGERRTKLVISGPKSEFSNREIPIPDFMTDMLKRFDDSDDIYLLTGKTKPMEPRSMQYKFARILKKLSLPSVHFHSLRHVFASNAVALGFDVKTLSELLGHSSVELTLNRYVHSDMNRKRICMDMLSWSD